GERPFLPARVDLVGDEHHRTSRAAEDLSDLRIERGRALSRVDDEQNDVGLVDGRQHLAAHALDEGLDGGGIEPAGVDHRRLPAPERPPAVEPVPRHPGHVAHQRLPAADQAIEERRLADVGPADDGEGRPRLRGVHRDYPSSARSKARAVGSTTRTGTPRSRARSAGVTSSRKTPSPSRTATAGTSTAEPTRTGPGRGPW